MWFVSTQCRHVGGGVGEIQKELIAIEMVLLFKFNKTNDNMLPINAMAEQWQREEKRMEKVQLFPVLSFIYPLARSPPPAPYLLLLVRRPHTPFWNY